MNDIKEKSDLVYDPSTIENVDMAIYDWLDKEMNLHADTNQGWQKTPIIWITGERSWQIKNNRDLRDSNNLFILPVITVERTNIAKDVNKKGKYWGNVFPIDDVKGGSIAIHQVINQEKTTNFARASNKRVTGQPNFKRENKKVVYKTKFIPMPVYVTMTYVIDIKTEYQQQMNQILQPLLVKTGGIHTFIVQHEGHRYEAFFNQNYQVKNNINDLQQNERLFNTQITIDVLAHIVGAGDNDNQPKISERENIVEVKIPKEYVIVGQENITAPFPLEKAGTDNENLILRTTDGDYILLEIEEE